MIVAAKTIDHLDKKIIQGVRHGMTYKEIAYEYRLTAGNVGYRLWGMRKYYECKNNSQLIELLLGRGLL
jgi:DNA-binding CsgD family transcriptional regulator